MITYFKQDAKFYAREIRSGNPFSLVRYGEGEWQIITPGVPPKSKISGREQRFKLWDRENPIRDLRHTIEEMHDDPRYWVADSSYRDRWKKYPEWRKLRRDFLKEHNVDKIWHDGSVWSKGVKSREFGVVSRAIRKCGLPIIFVGPERIRECVGKRFNVGKFFAGHPFRAYYDVDEIEEQILDFKKPAFISFGIGGSSKILIHRLYPKIGHHTFLVDFGAVWDGLCGQRIRSYMRKWNRETIRQAWGEQ